MGVKRRGRSNTTKAAPDWRYAAHTSECPLRHLLYPTLLLLKRDTIHSSRRTPGNELLVAHRGKQTAAATARRGIPEA